MRAFLAACVGIVVIAIAGYFYVNTLQKPTGVAYATDGVRIDPQWSWRSVSGDIPASLPATGTATKHSEDTAEECEPRTPWQWIFVDFGKPKGEPTTCTLSQ